MSRLETGERSLTRRCDPTEPRAGTRPGAQTGQLASGLASHAPDLEATA
jgi:hypothetical protein